MYVCVCVGAAWGLGCGGVERLGGGMLTRVLYLSNIELSVFANNNNNNGKFILCCRCPASTNLKPMKTYFSEEIFKHLENETAVEDEPVSSSMDTTEGSEDLETEQVHILDTNKMISEIYEEKTTTTMYLSS